MAALVVAIVVTLGTFGVAVAAGLKLLELVRLPPELWSRRTTVIVLALSIGAPTSAALAMLVARPDWSFSNAGWMSGVGSALILAGFCVSRLVTRSSRGTQGSSGRV